MTCVCGAVRQRGPTVRRSDAATTQDLSSSRCCWRESVGRYRRVETVQRTSRAERRQQTNTAACHSPPTATVSLVTMTQH